MGDALLADGSGALTEVARFSGHNGAAGYVVVSPDGRRLLSASADRTMILWDRETGREIRRFRAQGGRFTRSRSRPTAVWRSLAKTGLSGSGTSSPAT